MEIRNAVLGDLPYLYDICAKTALDGQDARGVMSDENKVGHYFAAPYVHYDLTSCFVLCEHGMVKGYLLGTTNTKKYSSWLNENWLKHIQPIYPNNDEVSGFDAFLNSVIHNETVIDERLINFEAHFHIDLLPKYQNKGWGTKLIELFFEHCKNNKVKKLHLMVSKTHSKALGFYNYLGFKELYKTEGALALGIEIT